ncbi:MAG: Asp-tRNA(Asn)/Glu-tRNA(Gln) amidotransferase subunit GatA [bacterium]|nr:Asp-tRNA(Asn)/Glu-tRNA(Gln) amidotransferase subunit GatA [bacterium]
MLLDKSIAELAGLLRKREITIEQLVLESIERCEQGVSLNCFISLRDKQALLKEAREKDAALSDDKHLLYGMPFSVKDSYVTQDLPTTSGSRVLKNFISPYTATVVQKLLDTGAILIGKNNQDSWGHGGSNENTDFGPVKNPWNPAYISGGSSGGSAVAVAARMVTFSIGEDTGGSIRNPASMCGISGLKVTYGRVSRYGTIAYASSLDTVGPLAKSAEDLAIVLQTIAGSDPKDGSSSHRPVDTYTEGLTDGVVGKKIGLPKQFFAENYNPEVRSTILAAVEQMKELGLTTVELDMPMLNYAIPIYYMLASSETSSNLARYDGVRYGTGRENFLPESARRIMLGTYALSAGYAEKLYKNAQRARTLLIDNYADAFKQCDFIAAPTTPSPAQKFGELLDNPMENMLADLFTATINIVGVPSLAVPAGFTADKLPIGLQIIGDKFQERAILTLARAYQDATTWHKEVPEIHL